MQQYLQESEIVKVDARGNKEGIDTLKTHSTYEEMIHNFPDIKSNL